MKVTALPGEDGPSLDVGTDDEKTQPNEEAPADDAESKPSIGITSANVTTNKSPTSTTWYCMLDMEKDVWSLPDGNEKAADTQDKCKSSSGTLDSEEDPMTEVYMKLNSARLSIVGRPLLNTQDRLRAMSSANKEQKVSQTILKLQALERSLKVRIDLCVLHVSLVGLISCGSYKNRHHFVKNISSIENWNIGSIDLISSNIQN